MSHNGVTPKSRNGADGEGSIGVTSVIEEKGINLWVTPPG